MPINKCPDCGEEFALLEEGEAVVRRFFKANGEVVNGKRHGEEHTEYSFYCLKCNKQHNMDDSEENEAVNWIHFYYDKANKYETLNKE